MSDLQKFLTFVLAVAGFVTAGMTLANASRRIGIRI